MGIMGTWERAHVKFAKCFLYLHDSTGNTEHSI